MYFSQQSLGFLAIAYLLSLIKILSLHVSVSKDHINEIFNPSDDSILTLSL